jgi:hypothetical protein
MYASLDTALQVAQFEHLISELEYQTGRKFVLTADGDICAEELPNGFVRKHTGPAPGGSELIRYGAKAFKHWTVADAEAFELGEAVDPFKGY